MEPKYAAVNGRRGPEVRCFAYAQGPIKTAQDARKKIEPNVHLRIRQDKSVTCSCNGGWLRWCGGARVKKREREQRGLLGLLTYATHEYGILLSSTGIPSWNTMPFCLLPELPVLRTTWGTYRVANLLGLSHRTGNRAKQRTKQTSAPTLHAPKTNRRSHLLTVMTMTLSASDSKCSDIPDGGKGVTWCGERRKESQRRHDISSMVGGLTCEPAFLLLSPRGRR